MNEQNTQPASQDLSDSEFKREVLNLLRQILAGVIMADVTGQQLAADVASETTLEGSLITLLQNAVAAVPGITPEQADAIDAAVQANIATLTAAVTANTPASTVPPSPAPAIASAVKRINQRN